MPEGIHHSHAGNKRRLTYAPCVQNSLYRMLCRALYHCFPPMDQWQGVGYKLSRACQYCTPADTGHMIGQDCKLDMHRWPLLHKLGGLLIDLAAMLGASEFIDFYQRDLGPSCIPAVSQQLPRAGEWPRPCPR